MQSKGGLSVIMKIQKAFSRKTKSLVDVVFFGEAHKRFILNYIDENLSAVLTKVVGSLLQNFVDLSVSRSIVYNCMTTQYQTSSIPTFGMKQRRKKFSKGMIRSISDNKLTWTLQQIAFSLMNQPFVLI